LAECLTVNQDVEGSSPSPGAIHRTPDSQRVPPEVDNGGMPPLPDDRIAERLATLPGWERSGDEILKTFELSSFPEAIAFVTRVADRAEAADHHPDLDIRYRKVRVALSTHDAGGITDKDFDLAAEIEAAAGPEAG
jgi:4a-hydroxytetrahydrobiopterin dehydratase